MRIRRTWARWLGLAAGVLWVSFSREVHLLGAPIGKSETGGSTVLTSPSLVQLEVPLSAFPEAVRPGIRMVIEKPTLLIHGPIEVFHGQPAMYHWLLDHPDQAVVMWRRLGAKCMGITDLGSGRFGWTDGKGSTVHWDTVYRDGDQRVWYAEGKVRPSPILPMVPVHAVVVMRYADAPDDKGRTLIRHQADLFLQTDSKTTALVARWLGRSAPELGQEGVGQLEMFFSALVWYLDRYPDRAESLLSGKARVDPSKQKPMGN